MGSDFLSIKSTPKNRHFNPRSPCGERLVMVLKLLLTLRFQSTLPVWGATDNLTVGGWLDLFQSTLPVWGATRDMTFIFDLPNISIHAPRVGSDGSGRKDFQHFEDFNPRSPCGERRAAAPFRTFTPAFQSTLPVWGATRAVMFVPLRSRISIHAPRVGSDRRRRLQGQI